MPGGGMQMSTSMFEFDKLEACCVVPRMTQRSGASLDDKCQTLNAMNFMDFCSSSLTGSLLSSRRHRGYLIHQKSSTRRSYISLLFTYTATAMRVTWGTPGNCRTALQWATLKLWFFAKWDNLVNAVVAI